jgi:ketosteroid isomerase-like protein
MTSTQVAQRLFDLCNRGQFMEAVEELYSPNIVSVEPMGGPTMPAEQRGIEAVRAKSAWWFDNHEVHGCKLAGPFVHGDRFIVEFDIDITQKANGNRMQMKEAGLYQVADGKIVREEFFMLPH